MQHQLTKALITGGSQGIGYEIARALIDEGCQQVVIASNDAQTGPKAAQALAQSGAQVAFLPVELAETAQVTEMVTNAAELMGGITALVNAAGITTRGSILNTTQQIWDEVMQVNARAPFFAMQAVANRAIEAGHPATIVNIGSITHPCGHSFLAPYAASKAALATLTRNAAQTLRKHRIRVNAICPGWMDTPGEDAMQRGYHKAPKDWLAQAEAQEPFGSLVKPGDVARLASYMLGPNSGVMTGAVVDFDQHVSGAPPESGD